MHEAKSRTKSIEEVLSYLEESIDTDTALLKYPPVVTDGGKDITECIEGRLLAYHGVKSFIKKGNWGEE